MNSVIRNSFYPPSINMIIELPAQSMLVIRGGRDE